MWAPDVSVPHSGWLGAAQFGPGWPGSQQPVGQGAKIGPMTDHSRSCAAAEYSRKLNSTPAGNTSSRRV